MKHKILLVDDEPGIRKVLGLSLEEQGYLVYTAENGAEALRIFREEQPMVVLTDIKMPGMDGIDVLRRIKQENPETEVIVITGHGDMDTAIRSLKYEASDFITKPISDEELENALEKSLRNIIVRKQLRDYTENLENLIHQKTKRLETVSRQMEEGENGGAYPHLFEEIPGYVMVVDPELKIRTINRNFKDDFGDLEDTDNYCYRMVTRKNSRCNDCPALLTFQDGESHDAELEYTNNKGETRKVLAWTTPIKDQKNRVERVMILSNDITRILDLKDHLSSLGLMIGSVSHGIKGLLTGLDGGLYLLDSGFTRDDPRKLSEGLEMVKLMAGRIKNMVLDILYYSKEREFRFEPVGVSKFAREIAEVVKSKMGDAGVSFRLEVHQELEEAVYVFDPEQLRTALINILENAADAFAEDRSEKERQVVFSVGEDRENMVFSIEDNGIGMDESTQKKIFTLFFSSKSNKGTGIGLFITNRIVEHHGGVIEVKSTIGKGSRFKVLIPKKAPTSQI